MRNRFAKIRNTLLSGLITALTMKKIANTDIRKQITLAPRSIGTSKRRLMPTTTGETEAIRAEYAGWSAKRRVHSIDETNQKARKRTVSWIITFGRVILYA